MRDSCGVGVVGGLLFSSLLTLYVIPSLYFLFVTGENGDGLFLKIWKKIRKKH